MRLRLAQAGYQIQTFGAPSREVLRNAAWRERRGYPGQEVGPDAGLRLIRSGAMPARYAAITHSAPEQAEHRVRGRAAGIMAERPRYRGQLTFQERDLLSAAEQAQKLGSQALGPHLAL